MGKPRQAERILLKAAERNKIPVENVKLALETHESQVAIRITKSKEKYNITHLFRTPNLRVKTICVSFNWFVCGICFFGLAQYMGHLDGDIFINVAVSGNSIVFYDYIKNLTYSLNIYKLYSCYGTTWDCDSSVSDITSFPFKNLDRRTYLIWY